jgi:mannose-6-phosphate isomerase
VDQALACVNFADRAGGLIVPVEQASAQMRSERLFQCEYFRLWRVRGESPFTVGVAGMPRVLVCIEGAGQVEHDGATYAARKGDVFLLPAVLGPCTFQPRGAVNVLEIEIPT